MKSSGRNREPLLQPDWPPSIRLWNLESELVNQLNFKALLLSALQLMARRHSNGRLKPSQIVCKVGLFNCPETFEIIRNYLKSFEAIRKLEEPKSLKRSPWFGRTVSRPSARAILNCRQSTFSSFNFFKAGLNLSPKKLKFNLHSKLEKSLLSHKKQLLRSS